MYGTTGCNANWRTRYKTKKWREWKEGSSCAYYYKYAASIRIQSIMARGWITHVAQFTGCNEWPVCSYQSSLIPYVFHDSQYNLRLIYTKYQVKNTCNIFKYYLIQVLLRSFGHALKENERWYSYSSNTLKQYLFSHVYIHNTNITCYTTEMTYYKDTHL
jgi:hypothetical protein